MGDVNKDNTNLMQRGMMPNLVSTGTRSIKVPRLVRIPFQPDLPFFPEDVSLLYSHQTVKKAPEEIRRDLLVLHLYSYLQFTVCLELGPVNEACKLLCTGQITPGLPLSIKTTAYEIFTEELDHAYMYQDMFNRVQESSGISPNRNEPAFLSRLDQILEQVDHDLVTWVKLFFVIISETLVTNQLAKVSLDKRVQPSVRGLVREHIYDEAKHHAFFRELFELLWPSLPRETRQRIGVLLPELIVAYLEPDRSTLLKMLESFPEVFPEPLTLINELLINSQSSQAMILGAALPTLEMFRANTVFSDDAIAEAFYNAGLLVPKSKSESVKSV